MFPILCFLASSTCDKIIEIADINSYQTVSTLATEKICFRSRRPKTLILFNHADEYEINSYQTRNDQDFLSQKTNLKAEGKKLIGFYFGSSTSNQIELISTKSNSFSYISTLFPHDCLNISISTLENDVINFGESEKFPSCLFHAHKNSTYAISIDADNASFLIGLKNGIQFNGRMSDYIVSSSELFYWVPSHLNKNTNFKASVTIGMPDKANNNMGFKYSIEPDKFLPIFIDNDSGSDGQGDSGGQDSNYPPKFNYNNIYQNGGIIFPTILYMILFFVLVFFFCLIAIRFIYCYCHNRSTINRNNPNNTQYQDDIPPVEPLSQSNFLTQNLQNQNIQIVPIQTGQQYYQNNFQPLNVYYPSLQEPQLPRQQLLVEQQPQLIQQQNAYQQIVYI